MKEIVPVLLLFILFSAPLQAAQNEFRLVSIPPWKILALGDLSISIISSPLVRVQNQPGRSAVVSPDDEEWKGTASQKWLSVKLEKPPRAEFSIREIPLKPPLPYSYSVYVSSPRGLLSCLFGTQFDVCFSYFTLNIEVSETVKIEAERMFINNRVKNQREIRFRASVVRFETQALDLFDENPGEIIKYLKFVDFYLADIEFLNPVRNP